MKRTLTLTVAFAFMFSVFAFAAETPDAKADESAQDASKGASALKTEKDKASYAIGIQIGQNLKMLGDNIDLPTLVKGLEDKFNGKESLLSDQEAKDVLKSFSDKMREQETAKRAAEAEKNKKAGEEFLAENKKKEGVKVTDDGLQYKIIKEGDGPKPGPDDTVKVDYKGTFINGEVFDSSEKHGEPLTIPVTGVIKGWTEALQMMPVGSKWKLFIPSDLAYGPHGPGEIGPDRTLIFEVELLSIEKKPESKEIPGTTEAPKEK